MKPQTCNSMVREGLDYHDCSECKKLALEDGLPWIDKKDTWIYTEEYMRKRNANKK